MYKRPEHKGSGTIDDVDVDSDLRLGTCVYVDVNTANENDVVASINRWLLVNLMGWFYQSQFTHWFLKSSC